VGETERAFNSGVIQTVQQLNLEVELNEAIERLREARREMKQETKKESGGRKRFNYVLKLKEEEIQARCIRC
jgi:hypothetical protein